MRDFKREIVVHGNVPLKAKVCPKYTGYSYVDEANGLYVYDNEDGSLCMLSGNGRTLVKIPNAKGVLVQKWLTNEELLRDD